MRDYPLYNRPKYKKGAYFRPIGSNCATYEVVAIIRESASFRYMLKRHYPICTGLPFGILEKGISQHYEPCKIAQVLYGKKT